jgi:S1-C subfamily serine protease
MKIYFWLPGCIVLGIVAVRWQDVSPVLTQVLPTPPTPTIQPVSFQAPSNAEDLIPNLIERSSGSVFIVRTSSGLGSGFAVKLANGRVVGLTNAHVVQDESSVALTTFTGVPLQATVIGKDQKADVAVLELSAALTPLPTSSAVRQGEVIVAMGSPVGIQGVATVGRVSKVAHQVNDRTLMIGDVDIAPGNSGGCSLNTKGEVVGINSGVDKRAASLSYLIPIASAMQTAEAIAK